MQSNGVVAVVTGGGSGLGEASARRLAADGATVAVMDVDPSAAQRVADGIGGVAFAVDVSDEAGVVTAFAGAAEVLGPPRVLVHCAGIGGFSRLLRRNGPHPTALWDRILGVNLQGTFLCCRAAADLMARLDPLDTGERGVMITTSSISGLDGPTGAVAYAASKAAVAAMTIPMARDLSDHAIRVVSIAPGSFDTALLAGMPSEAVAAMAAAKPFPKRSGHPSEFADTVAWIVGNSMVNGSVIRLDGGERMGWP